MSKHPSAGNNHTNNPSGGGKTGGNKGIKTARDQARRQRAYDRGGTKPKEAS
jgi:hypothetical protein